MSISFVILTRNNENTVSQCLDSIKSVADEIIIIDGKSTDKTLNICKKYGCKIYISELDHNKDSVSNDRNLGDSKCKSEWIFQLDSDEVLSNKLIPEIASVINTPTDVTMYNIPRKEYFLGKYLMTIKISRLYKRNTAKWEGILHEELKTTGKIDSLKHPIIHLGQMTMDYFLNKYPKYVYLASVQRGKNKLSKPFIIWSMFYRPIVMFFGLLIYKKLIFRGLRGFIWCTETAQYEFLVYSKIYEQQYCKKDIDQFIKNVSKETKEK